MNEKDRQVLRDLLSNHICTITFKKTNGEERVMRCTLRSDTAPARVEERKVKYTSNPDVCPVYDIEAKGWRSFRFDSVTVIQFSLDPDYARGEDV